MITRYTRPEMAAIWSPDSKFGIWLEIETLAAEAMEQKGKGWQQGSNGKFFWKIDEDGEVVTKGNPLMQNHIQQAEKQLALIESKKKQLQPKYKSFKQQAMTPDTEAAPPANNYFDMFEQIISQELCHATQLATLLRAQDSFV
mgnify:CR=1 FL=1